MEHVYPGGIGCIIQKGEWLKKLGEMARMDLLSLFQVLDVSGNSWCPFSPEKSSVELFQPWVKVEQRLVLSWADSGLA